MKLGLGEGGYWSQQTVGGSGDSSVSDMLGLKLLPQFSSHLNETKLLHMIPMMCMPYLL